MSLEGLDKRIQEAYPMMRMSDRKELGQFIEGLVEMKCLRGEHGQGGGFIIEGNNGGVVSVCKHCRCLFVEKA